MADSNGNLWFTQESDNQVGRAQSDDRHHHRIRRRRARTRAHWGSRWDQMATSDYTEYGSNGDLDMDRRSVWSTPRMEQSRTTRPQPPIPIPMESFTIPPVVISGSPRKPATRSAGSIRRPRPSTRFQHSDRELRAGGHHGRPEWKHLVYRVQRGPDRLSVAQRPHSIQSYPVAYTPEGIVSDSSGNIWVSEYNPIRPLLSR